MNRQITRLALAGVGLIVALVVATTYWQAWAAGDLADRQDNQIERVAQFTIKRGEIKTKGALLAAQRREEGRRAHALLPRLPDRTDWLRTSSATRRSRASAPGSSAR